MAEQGKQGASWKARSEICARDNSRTTRGGIGMTRCGVGFVVLSNQQQFLA